MTVTYTQQVATAKCGFYVNLLLRWKGSIYKLLWKDFVLFLILYYSLRVIYRNILSETQKRIFEEISVYTRTYSVLIPFSFVLGIYMQVIFQRWLGMFNYITWPDRMALAVTANIKGLDERGRLIRRTIMRYLMVGYIMNQRSVCPSVKRRFPTMNHLTQAGLLTAQEEKIIEDIPQNRVNKYVIPFLWTVNVIALARKEGRIYDDYAVSILNQELLNYRIGLGMILRYDQASIPLVYTQSVTLAVHMFVLFSIFGSQFLEQREDGGAGDVDQYVHLGSLLQFFLYMGWLKLAEMMINPFGDDDDDFDMNVLIDRNLQYCYLVVDDLHSDMPPLFKDMYWNQQLIQLPYTKVLADKARAFNTDMGSAYEVVVPEDKSAFVTMADSPSRPRRRTSIVRPKLPATPEEPKDKQSTLPPDADHGSGISTTLGKLKKSASENFASPKKFFETVEQQFHTSDGIVEISDPFDNRFEEVEYKDHVRGLKADDEEGGAAGVQPDKDAKRGGSILASGVATGIKQFFARDFFGKKPVHETDSTVGIVPTPPKKYTTENPPKEPPPQPPPEQHPSQPVTSWHLPQ